jgi:transcriptional regulator with XRE-family HTH domain
MENKKLAQGVKELRKRKGLSQDELAKESGLSLRTVQRVENGETESTGETLKRISTVLDVTPKELIEWNNKKEIPKKTVKTKYEYLHIFDDKLVISKTEEIKDLVNDYGKSVNNMFKSLTVIFIAIPIFTTLAVIFYNMGRTELAIQGAGFAFLFLIGAFNVMLFTSGSSLIKMDSIYKVQILRKLSHNIVVISHKESGRLKKRTLIIEKNQLDTIKYILLSEKLIEEKDIKLKRNYSGYIFVLAIVIFFIIPKSLTYNKDINLMISVFMPILFSAIMVTKMIIGLIKPLLNETTNR